MSKGAPCVLDGMCVSSPNYPRDYGTNEECSFSLNTPVAGRTLVVEAFNTERCCDKLTICTSSTVCVDYSGDLGVQGDLIDGSVPLDVVGLMLCHSMGAEGVGCRGSWVQGSFVPRVPLAPEGNFKWRSNEGPGGVRSGWRICVPPPPPQPPQSPLPPRAPPAVPPPPTHPLPPISPPERPPDAPPPPMLPPAPPSSPAPPKLPMPPSDPPSNVWTTTKNPDNAWQKGCTVDTNCVESPNYPGMPRVMKHACAPHHAPH